MKKKILYLFIFILVLGLVGCGKKEKTLKEKINEKHTFIKQVKCELDEDIVDLSKGGSIERNKIITKNKVYTLNLKRIFSNEQNCKEVKIDELDDELIRFNGPRIISTKKYDYTYDENVKKYTNKKKNYIIDSDDSKNNLDTMTNNKYIFFTNMGENVLFHYCENHQNYYIVSVDNIINVVEVTFKQNLAYAGDMWLDEEYVPDVSNITKLKSNFAKDEKVLSVSSKYIKTNKAYYMIINKVTNEKECNKYADVKCKNEWVIEKDEVLSDNYDDILFAGDLIIDKDFNVYYFEKYNNRK